MAKNFNNFNPASAPLTITSASNLAVVVSKSDGSNPITLNAQAYNGSAEVDIHAIVETMFEDVQTNRYTATYLTIQEDGLLVAKCKIKEGTGTTQDYSFIRGVNKIVKLPEWYIMTQLGWKEHNDAGEYDNFYRVSNYIGYPQPITQYLEAPQITNSFHQTLLNTQDYNIFTMWFKHDVLTRPEYTISDQQYVNHISVKLLPPPAHPFYVRWINRYGGWETWMFACNQKYTRALTKNEYFNNRNGESVSIIKEGAERVEVSSGVVDDNTREELSLMVYSPLIQLYDQATDTWHNIQIDKADIEWMVATPTHELIMSFVLPTPKMYK